MLISVVTPVFNGAKTIARTLESLAGQRAEYEHIVMDAGSTDNTEEIVRSYSSRYPVKWFQKRDRSLYEGVWNGMQQARGDVLCYINADDYFLPWTLATVTVVFSKHKEIEWITGMPNIVSEKSGAAQLNRVIPVYPKSWIDRGWFSSACMGPIQQESTFWRRSLWERSRPEEILLKYRLAGDYHLWRRFATHAELRTVCAVLAAHSMSGGQLSWAQRDVYMKECGLSEVDGRRPMWARLLYRLTCIVRQFDVLGVPDIESR